MVNVVGILPAGQVIVVLDVPVIYGIIALDPLPLPEVKVGAVPPIVAFLPLPVKSYKLVLVLLG